MSYAIIQLAGKQYKVAPNEELTVNLLPYKVGEKVKHADVLLVADGDNVTVGTPLVKGAVVEFTVKNHERGDKIRVFKYKSKSRYRRTQGHRQELSVVTINGITL